MPARSSSVDQVELVSLVDGALELSIRQPASDVDQRAERTRDRNPFSLKTISSCELAAMDTDTVVPAISGAGHAHVDRTGPGRSNPPHGGRALMAQECAFPAREHSGHPPALVG
jgi:hypothetical protein